MSDTRPAIRLENIPQCLRDHDQWVLWRYVVRDGTTTKIPYSATTGREASSTNPETWASYERAVAAWKQNHRWSGIGFVFAPDDPFCGVDLDDSLDPATHALKPWAQAIVDRLQTYCEISPSGQGVKLFLIAAKPADRCRRGYHDGEVEIYDQERFFTVTGERLDGTPAGVEARQAELERVYQEVFGGATSPALPAAGPMSVPAAPMSVTAAPAPAGPAPALTDEQILHKATRSQKSGPKFALLWAGQWNSYFGSASEADSSVVFTLAFYTKDAGQIDRLFRLSGLMRPKWDEKHGARTYGQATIANALATVTGQWQPKVRRAATAPRPPGDWQPPHLSQQVNAERLVQLLAGNARYDVGRGRWAWFDGLRFAPDDAGRVDRAAKRVARQTWGFVTNGLADVEPKTAFRHAVDSEKAAGIAAMMKLAQTEEGTPVRAEAFDADPELFNCLSGTIDLRTGTQRPHDRADLLTKLAPVSYDPASPRPLFDAFLSRIMDGKRETVEYLQRLLGRCLGGDISEQEIYFFLGEGANGKSVLIDTVLGVLGDYAGTAPESLLTVQTHNEHPTEIADLCGKRLVVASETEEGARLKVQLVKRLTGDQRLKGRFMRQDFFEFDRTHKLIVVSNNKPVIRETRHAIWRRIRLVPFAVTIPEAERDPRLTEKLKAEWPGILAWLVEGYRDWRLGGMRTPQEVLVATQTYQSEQDPLADYLADRLVQVAGAKVSRNDLLGDYLSWCQQTGDKFPLGRNALFEHVRGLKGVCEDQWRAAAQATPVRGFRGVGLSFGAAGVAETGDV